MKNINAFYFLILGLLLNLIGNFIAKSGSDLMDILGNGIAIFGSIMVFYSIYRGLRYIWLALKK